MIKVKLRLGTLRHILSEALKKSDAARAATHLENAAGKINSRVSASVDLNGQLINVFVKLVSGEPDVTEAALVAAANDMGWSLLSRSERRGTVWWFEPSHLLKGAVSSNRLPQYLFHTTPSANVEKILEKGLELRSRSAVGTTRRYSPRVYFATEPNGAKATAKSGEDWAMLRVDRDKLPRSQKFYVDQEFGHRPDGTPVAVYTLEPIDPEAISIV